MSPEFRLVALSLLLLITIVATEALAVGTVMPLVEADLGDLWLYGWVFSAFGIGQVVGIPVGGHLADRVDPTVVLLGALALFTAGLLAGGLAPTMAVLVAGRALQGLGAGAVPAVAYAMIGRALPAEARPRMFAWMSAAWLLPGLVSPPAAAWVGEGPGWRWVFLGLVPIVVVGAVVVVVALRGTLGSRPVDDRPAAPPLPLAAIAALALGVALLLAGLGARRLWLAIPGVALGGALTLHRLAALSPAGTLRCRPGLPAAVLLRGLLTAAFFTAEVYLALGLNRLRGATPVLAGAALGAAAFAWALGAYVQARLVERVGARRLVRIGFAIVALGGSATGAIVLSTSVPAALVVPIWMFSALGIGLAYAPLSLTVLGEAPPGREGASASALQLFDTLGLTIGPGVGAAFVAAADRGSWSLWWALAATFAISPVCGLVGATLAGRLPGARHGALHHSTSSQPV